MVVDDVEDDGEDPSGGTHSPNASGRQDRPYVDCGAYIPTPSYPPIAPAGKLGDRHDFDRRYAQIAQILQARNDGVEGTLRRKRASV
ncbi:MAG: hypothetical protein WDO73_22945 [Ignavibacteriota bacterium]